MEDYQRYSKQLEVMETICREFENPTGGAEASSEKILQLMQQLQQHGQPPDDMAGENVSMASADQQGRISVLFTFVQMQQAGLPPGLQNLLGGGGGVGGENCTVM